MSLNTGVPVILHFPSNLDDPAQIGLTTDCIWNVTAPQNSIIEINMVATAKYGPDIYVKPTTGGADDDSLIVLRSNTYDVMYSNASAIKIYADAIRAIYFKIQLTAYTEKGIPFYVCMLKANDTLLLLGPLHCLIPYYICVRYHRNREQIIKFSRRKNNPK